MIDLASRARAAAVLALAAVFTACLPPEGGSYESLSGSYESLSGSYEAPSGRYEAPSGSYEAPSGRDAGIDRAFWPGAHQDKAAEWQPLFDGKSLGSWQPTKFIGQRAVTVEDGRLTLHAGNDMTGVTWGGPALPTTDYELALQAMRVEGGDFFAGITFPVGQSFCSLVLGGWGGTVIGLSSINGQDASENSTSQSREFENKRWYDVRIRVTSASIRVWLDDRQIIDQPLANARVHTRDEMDASKPLGIATWRTTGAIKDIRVRRVPAA